MDSPTDFSIDTRAIPQKDNKNHMTCVITNPSGSKSEKMVVPIMEGVYKVSYTPFEEGKHIIDIFYDKIPVPGSPFIVNVRRTCDPKKCRAFGPGLEKGYVNKPCVFTVETKGNIYDVPKLCEGKIAPKKKLITIVIIVSQKI